MNAEKQKKPRITKTEVIAKKLAEQQLNIFFVATTKLEKIEHLNEVAAKEHYPALFLPLTSLGEPAHSVEENEWNFPGNMKAKCHSGADYLAHFTKEQIHDSLSSLGFTDQQISKIRLFCCAEDSGLSYYVNGDAKRSHKGDEASLPFVKNDRTKAFEAMFFDTSSKGPYNAEADKAVIDGLKKLYNPDLPFPGSETVRVFGAARGYKNFSRLVDLTLEKLGMTSNLEKGDHKNALSIMDISSLGAFEWKPGEVITPLPDDKIIVGKGRSDVYHHSGQHREGEHTSYAHTVTRNRARKGDFTTREEMPKRYQPQARGNAFNNLMFKLGITRLDKDIRRDYETQQTMQLAEAMAMNPFKVAVVQSQAAKEIAENLIERCKDDRIAAYDARPKGEKRFCDSLYNFQNLLANNDAYVLLPPPKAHTDSARDLEDLTLLSYLAIHKELDPDGKGKTILLLDETGHDWNRPMQQFTNMFNQGTLADRPSDLFPRVKTVEDAVQFLKKKKTTYRRTPHKPEPDSAVPDIKTSTGRFNVCVFLSASMEGVNEDKAHYLGYRLQEEGMGLTYGAADRNMMGALYHGALQYEEETGNKAEILGSTTRIIATTECKSSSGPERIEQKKFYLAPNITKRKEFLFKNSDAFVLMEGGVGTLDELLTYMWYKKNQPDMVKDKPMIISESACEEGSIFSQALKMFLDPKYKDKDLSHLNNQEREAIRKETGIVLMQPPLSRNLPPDNRRLHEIEIDAVMEELNKWRKQKHPDLIPSSSYFAKNVRKQPHAEANHSL